MDVEFTDEYNSKDAKIPSKSINDEIKPKSKKLLIFSVIIIILIFVVAFVLIKFYPNFSINQPVNKYEISLTHNGIPLRNVLNSSDLGLIYGIDIYNDSSVCYQTKNYPDNGDTTLTTYSFNGTTTIGNEKLSDYAAKDYAYDLYAVYVPFNSTFASFEADLISKDCCTYNSTVLHSQLPKLINSYSVNFDLPLFNRSSFVVFKNMTENTINAHIEMIDAWNQDFTYVCQFRRAYDPQIDSSMPQCIYESVTQTANNQQCAKKTLSAECGGSYYNFVTYGVSATKNGKNIDCKAPLSDLTSSKDYYVRLIFYKPLSNYFLRYQMENTHQK